MFQPQKASKYSTTLMIHPGLSIGNSFPYPGPLVLVLGRLCEKSELAYAVLPLV